MKKIVYLITLFASVMQAQVGIGTPAPKGALDINADLPAPSTDQAGFVPPIVSLTATDSFNTTTSTIINPNGGAVVTGTIVYNNNTAGSGATQVTPGYYFYNGTAWEKLGSGAASGNDWSINGNAGTDATVDFVGTTDPEDLVVKTDNTERMRIGYDGRVGIGSNNLTSFVKINAPANSTPPFEIVPSATTPVGGYPGQMAMMDGSLYLYDDVRDKWLSSETMVFTFGRTGTTGAQVLGYGGAAGSILSGAKILKNATIVGIAAQSSTAASNKRFDLFVSGIFDSNFQLTGGSYYNSADIHIDAGEFISIRANNTPATTAAVDPTVTLYVKWER